MAERTANASATSTAFTVSGVDKAVGYESKAKAVVLVPAGSQVIVVSASGKNARSSAQSVAKAQANLV